jgi:hypothetical protein
VADLEGKQKNLRGKNRKSLFKELILLDLGGNVEAGLGFQVLREFWI